jgi:biopolymer transport protein ExbD
MRYSPRHRASHVFETFALTDIILNLFIFFFITFSLVYIPKSQQTEAAVSIELPRAGRGEARPARGPLLVSLKADETDTVYIGEEAVPAADLAERIRALPPDRLAQGAVLRCDRTVSIERTLQTLAILSEAGIRDVSVAAEPAQP